MPRDGNSQTRTTHIKDRSFNHPRGLIKGNKPFKANVTEKYDEWMAGEAGTL